MKKTALKLNRATDPAPNPLDAFVEAGEEPRASDLRRALGDQPKTTAKGETTRLTLDISKDLHKRAKQRCLDLDQTLADYLRGLMESDLGKDQR